MNFFIGVMLIIAGAFKDCSSHPVLNSTSTKIHPGDYPYQCIIRIKSESEDDFLLCEGTIIAKKWVLTAAGCIDKYKSNHEMLQVVAGIVSTEDIKSQSQAQVRRVEDVEISPYPNNSGKKFDGIALLKIRELEFNKYVNRAKIGGNVTVNQNTRLIGYGESDNLTSVDLKVTSKQESNFSCTKKNSSDEHERAFYDESFAGAPLVSVNNSSSTDMIFGIMSAKNGSVFTSVAPYKSWIEKIANISQSNITTEDESEDTESSDDEAASDGSSDNKNGTTSTTESNNPEDEDETSESEEDIETTTKPEDEDEEESSEEVESSEEKPPNDTTEESSEESEDTDEENSDHTTTTESSESDETEESSEEESTTTTTESSESEETEESSEEESTTSRPTSTTSSPSSTSTTQKTSSVSPSSTTQKTSTASPSSTTQRVSSTTTISTSSTTVTETTSSATTPSTSSTTEEDDYDYYEETTITSSRPSTTSTTSTTDSKSNNENDIKFDPNNAAEGNSVTSNSAKPLNSSLISNLVSKVSQFLRLY